MGTVAVACFVTIPAPAPHASNLTWRAKKKLQLEQRLCDLALITLGIDSKLRGCDLIALRVSDVAPNSCALDRASVRQKKTGRPVRFKLTE
jgi:hypothetical protein